MRRSCWACGEYHESGQKCPWVCEECECRLPGALGHGPACDCESARGKAIEIMIAKFGPEVAAEFFVATDKSAEMNVRKDAIDALTALIISSDD